MQLTANVYSLATTNYCLSHQDPDACSFPKTVRKTSPRDKNLPLFLYCGVSKLHDLFEASSWYLSASSLFLTPC